MASGLKQLGRDMAVYGMLDMAMRFVGIFLVPIYTRVLVPADYGALDIMTTLAAVLYTVLYCGLDSALSFQYNRTSDEAERRKVAASAFGLWTILVTAGSVVLVLGATPLARVATPGIADGPRLIVLALLGLPFQAITGAQALLLRLRFELRRYVVLMLGRLIATVSLTIYLVVWLRLGVAGVLIAQLVANALFSVVGAVLTYQWFRSRPHFGLGRAMLRYGIPLTVPNLAYWVLIYAERFAILHYVSAGEVGLYGVASRVATFVVLISGAIDIAWMPFALSIQLQSDAPRTYARALTSYMLLTGVAGWCVAVFSREVIALLTAPAYHASYLFVGPIVAATILRGAFNIGSVGLFVTERTGRLVPVGILTTVVDLLLLAVLAPIGGAMGVAMATLLARFSGWVLMQRDVNRFYPVPFEWGRIARTWLVLGITGVAGVLVSGPGVMEGLLIKALLLLPLTIAALFAARAVKWGDAELLLQRLQSWRRARSLG